jgi:hypothetical protein
VIMARRRDSASAGEELLQHFVSFGPKGCCPGMGLTRNVILQRDDDHFGLPDVMKLGYLFLS